MAVVGVLLGVASAFIVLNRPVEPLDPPLPTIDWGALGAVAQQDEAVRRRVDAAPFPAEVRAVGSAYLAWNAAAASGMDPRDPERDVLATDIRSALGVARGKLGDEKALAVSLRDLRAYHAQLFIEELRRRARTGVASEELKRLAGALLDVLDQNGWTQGAAVRVPEPILRARFKLHWTSIVYSLEDCEHAPPPTCYALSSLPLEPVELRSLLDFLVQHPVVREEDLAEAGTLEHAIDRRRLVYLDRLAALDRFASPAAQTHPYLADYPYILGRGALLFRLGRYDVAEESLRMWAAAHPDDARAKNWWLGALQKLRGE